MTQTVEMPDGTVHEFPDEATPEMMATALGLGGAMGGAEAHGEDAGTGAAFGEALANVVPGGQKITSGLAAGALSLAGQGNYWDLYNQAEANTKATAEAHPIASLAGTVTGIIPTLGLGVGAAKWAAKPVFQGTGALPAAGNLVSKSMRGATISAPIGALYGAGSAKSLEEIPEDAVLGAKIAAAIGAAAPVVGGTLGYAAGGLKNIGKGIKARDIEALENASANIKMGASKAYEYMKSSGATFTPSATSNIVSNAENALINDGLLNKGLHGNTMAVLDDFKKASKSGDFTLENLDQWRQLFGDVAGNPMNKADARKSRIIIEAIDDAVEKINEKDLSAGGQKAVEALKMGRVEWHKARKFESISDIVRKSDGDANYLKRELKKFADNPKKTRGFTPDEISSLQEASRLSGGEGVLKMLGKFGFDTGKSRIGAGVGAVVGSVGGSAVLGTPGAVLAPVVGTAARYGQKYIARGKVEDLLKLIESGGKKLTPAEINQLPPSEAEKYLRNLRK